MLQSLAMHKSTEKEMMRLILVKMSKDTVNERFLFGNCERVQKAYQEFTGRTQLVEV